MKIKNLSDLLDAASKAYYEGSPIMSDESFDKLAEYLNYTKVGYESNSRDVKPHMFRMYSLQKHYEADGEPPFRPSAKMDVARSPKLDGAAVSHLYMQGAYTMSLTRGNGISGTDITDKFMDSGLIPMRIPKDGIVQITGEVVAPKSIPNARNYASGALGLDDLEEFRKRKLTFIAYGLEGTDYGTYTKNMSALREWGFNTIFDSEWEEFPQDGIVFRIDNSVLFSEQGFTSKHPKGAYALKTKTDGEIAEILDVVWETGKSGKVTPVAIISPVVINGATITRVTLNNPGFIEEMDLDIGDHVEVIRAGDIIPCIVGKIEL